MGDRVKDGLAMLARWREDGTGDHLENAMARKIPVQCPRTDGTLSPGVIVSCGGYGGLQCLVQVDKEASKWVLTERLLDLNPWLRGDT